tara:strand:- start:718 stop:1506 length:789 start_codon:yes stop_codon:yes gene_type:complete
MANCGINLNLTNIVSEIASKADILVTISGFVGTPPGVATLQGVLAGAIVSVKAKIKLLVPNIPFASDFINLRDQLGEYAKLPDQLSSAAQSQLNGILGDYADVINIDGFANIDLANLAKSAISVGVSFDPCAIANGIPNIVKDSAGKLLTLPENPYIGQTDYKNDISKITEQFEYVDDAVEGLKNNVNDITSLIGNVEGKVNSVLELTDINNIRGAFEDNVNGAISALGQSLKKTKSGATILQSQEDFLLEQISFRKFLEEG